MREEEKRREMREKKGQRGLRTQLSLGFAVIVFATVALVSLTANLFITHRFEKYVEAQQKEFAADLAAALSGQYNPATGEWNSDYIHGFGMYALSDGYILKLFDREGNTVWDAENHDMTLCHQVMNQISLRMEEEKPEVQGDFVTSRYALTQGGQKIGHVDISYYSPYYFNENAFQFVDSLNQILVAAGLLSLLCAILAGIFFSKKITQPLSRATELAREISQGNYEIRMESNSSTRELLELKEAVNQMASSLGEQESLRRRLTGDVAHELRTPLANVSSHLEAILEGVWEPTRERLQGCYDQLQRICGIVTDLEKLRQMEAESLSLKKEPVDLLSLTRSVLSSFEPELAKKHISCQIAGGPLSVCGDENRLRQVISNLLSNAVKYTNEGGQIRIGLQKKPSSAILTVADDGIGISEKELPLIFERFYRTDRSRSRKTGGAGIGLTIAKTIVQAHGGQITAESREGQGSIFTVSLPRE